jgi:hypothetical protein
MHFRQQARPGTQTRLEREINRVEAPPARESAFGPGSARRRIDDDGAVGAAPDNGAEVIPVVVERQDALARGRVADRQNNRCLRGGLVSLNHEGHEGTKKDARRHFSVLSWTSNLHCQGLMFRGCHKGPPYSIFPAGGRADIGLRLRPRPRRTGLGLGRIFVRSRSRSSSVGCGGGAGNWSAGKCEPSLNAEINQRITLHDLADHLLSRNALNDLGVSRRTSKRLT